MTATALRSDHPTRFAHLRPGAARAVLSSLVVAGLLLVAITLSPWRSGFADAASRGAGDVALYNATIDRIGGGETYYSAAKAELEVRGYPTRSILNWRTPLPVWLIGVLPVGAGQVLLTLVAVGVLAVAGHVVTKRAGLRLALTTLLFLTGALLPVALPGPYVMSEVWCGVLLAASLVCYGIDRKGFAVACGLAALFVRELAAPYCLVCGFFAMGERRWKEVGGWLAGALAYAGFYAWHVSQVLPLIEADARTHAEGWLQLGGAAFVISLVQMNVYLLLLPQWLSAIYLLVALLGFAALDGAWGRRAAWAACVYVLAFGFVGQPFNQYWGAVIAPLFCFGAGQGMAAIVDLWRAARLPGTAALSGGSAALEGRRTTTFVRW
ncbi:MAG: hypothetical protein WD894_21555 [Pirellulales bacterium]